MNQTDYIPSATPTPSPSRLRYVQTRLQADTDAVLREIAYVLKLTEQVKAEILSERRDLRRLATQAEGM